MKNDTYICNECGKLHENPEMETFEEIQNQVPPVVRRIVWEGWVCESCGEEHGIKEIESESGHIDDILEGLEA